MKPIKILRSRRGNALVLAILATMLLFIIGMAFLSSTMTERATTVTVEQDAVLDNGIDMVIDRINQVLVDDVNNRTQENRVLSGETRNYDYPDGSHPWLASLEPEYDDGTTSGVAHYYWRHITDLWGTFQDWMPGNLLCYYDPDDYSNTWLEQIASDNGSIHPDLFRVSENHVPIRVVLENEVIEHPILNQMANPVWRNWPIQPSSHMWGGGMRADADGDGIADARWVRLNRFGSQNQWLWAAVRIIDHGGMININTAYRNPEDPGEGVDPLTNPQWDGTRLSHVNLKGIRASTEDNTNTITTLQYNRYGARSDPATIPLPADYMNDTLYEEEVALRVLNPFYDPTAPLDIYQPFDFFDELELRNRYLMFSSMQPRCGSVWPVTFTPGPSGVGKKYPYMEAINPAISPSYDIGPGRSLFNWFNKVTPDIDPPLSAITIGDYNRRHLVTTYNFDRILRRGDGNNPKTPMLTYPGNRKVPIRLPDEIPNDANGRGFGQHSGFANSGDKDRYARYLAGAIHRGLPSDNDVKARFGDYYTRYRLAWTWALNLIDAQDSYDDGALPPAAPKNLDTPSYFKADVGNIEFQFYGVETLDILKKHTLCISKLGYVEISDNWGGPPPPANKPPTGKYYAIELFNPDDTPGVDGQKNLADPNPLAPKFKVQVLNSDDEEKGALDLTSGTISASDPATNGGGDTEVIIFVNDTANTNAAGNPLDVHAETAFASTMNGTPTEITPSDWFELEEGDKIVLLNTTLDDMPVDCVTVPMKLFESTIDDPNVICRKLTFPGTNFLLPTPTDADQIVLDRFWQEAGTTNTQLGDALEPIVLPATPSYGKTYNHLYPITGNFSPYRIEASGIENVKLAQTNELMRTVGEIVNPFALGYVTRMDDSGADEKYEYQTLWQGLADSVVAIKNLDEPLIANQTPLADVGVAGPLGSFGRVRLDDPIFMRMRPDDLATFPNNEERQYANVFDMLTYFDPTGDLDRNGDWVDNDGNPWTSNNPRNDDVDQDGDGQDIPIALGGGPGDIDNDEDEPRWYEQNVAGRININTAPWFVIAQLPWVQDLALGDPFRYDLARAIVAYRDKTILTTSSGVVIDYATPPPNPDPAVNDYRSRKYGMGLHLVDDPDVSEKPGFASIWELINVTHDLAGIGGVNYDPAADIRRLGRNTLDDDDITDADGDTIPNYQEGPFYKAEADPLALADDLEERDILVKRISNLVTVRSDVFTAYILVRIGRDGPQKRMMAIFDRSNVYSSSDRPKLVALHPVPDPR
jgi:hypothetical protein